MSSAPHCNVCFKQPRGSEATKYALTNCGHVLCEPCLRRGKKEECTVCRAHCRIVFLSGQLNPDVKDLFMDVNFLCKKYSKEFAQISEFQENHRRRCLAFYKEKIAKLEDMIKKLTQNIQQLQSVRSPQLLSRVPSSSTVKHSTSSHSGKHNEYSSYSLPLSRPSPSEVSDSMEVDISSQIRKPDTKAGPNRLSLISPPHDGRMGCVSHKGSHPPGLTASQNSFSGSVRSTPARIPQQATARIPQQTTARIPQQANGYSHISSVGSQSSRIRLCEPAYMRASQMYQQTPSSSQSSAMRHQISIASLLQRQHLGPSNFRGHTLER